MIQQNQNAIVNKIKMLIPVSVLPTFAKVFRKIIRRKMSIFVEKNLSPYMCGYGKGFSTQQALLPLIESWK